MNSMQKLVLGWEPEEPTSRGVANAVSRAIRAGVLKPGATLPPIRAVAKELGLSPTTVSAAWSLLARSGAIQTDGRRGTKIAQLHPGSVRYRRALERNNAFALDLSTGVPDRALLPDLAPVLGGMTSSLAPGSYLDEPVIPELIEALKEDWPYPAEHFSIVDGAMDAVELAARALVRFGDRVIVENPTFPLLLDQLEANGAEVVGVPVDEQGMVPGLLGEALKEPATVVVLQPRAQNPTGVSLTPARAEELANVLEESDAMVIEDDSAGYVAWTPEISLGTWLPDRTVHIRSFSKSHGPDLRLAAMSGPTAVMTEIASRRQLGQGWTSRLLQHILHGLITEAQSIGQVDRARLEYHRRREELVGALRHHGIDVLGADGLNVWVPVADETAATVRLASQGIGVAPGSPFTTSPLPSSFIRVTVASVSESVPELAAMIADAAQTGVWGGLR